MRTDNVIPTQRAQFMDARETRKELTEKELAEVLQAYFRRFVMSARIERDAAGVPVVRVEFAAPKVN
jgi:hypothetical protein